MLSVHFKISVVSLGRGGTWQSVVGRGVAVLGSGPMSPSAELVKTLFYVSTEVHLYCNEKSYANFLKDTA